MRGEHTPRDFVGDPRQIASVRRIVLADGAESGVEALAFSTGGGLDFWIFPGRLLDIGTLSWRGAQIAWQSPAGFRPLLSPTRGGRDFGRAFGGFLNTCGFDHIRQPADGKPMHGSAPFMPARLIGYGEAWDATEPILYCEGEAVVWAFGAGGHRVRRRIEAPIGGATIRIVDRVEIVGPTPLPIMTLYHFNLGYPLHRAGTSILFDGADVSGRLPQRESAALPSKLYPAKGDRAACGVRGGGGIEIEFRWNATTLPWLQLWRDLRPGNGVLSVEPCSTGRNPDGTNAEVQPTATGDGITFEVEICVGDAPDAEPGDSVRRDDDTR